MTNISLKYGESCRLDNYSGLTCIVTMTYQGSPPKYRKLDVIGEFAENNILRRDNQIHLSNLPPSTTVTLSIEPYSDDVLPVIANCTVTISQADLRTLRTISLPAIHCVGRTDAILVVVRQEQGSLIVSVPEADRDEQTDPVAREISQFICERGTDAVATSPVMVIVDVTASMTLHTSPRILAAMCKFAAGVVAPLAGANPVEVYTTARVKLPVKNAAGLAKLDLSQLSQRDAGWRFDPTTQEFAGNTGWNWKIVFISDEVPAVLSASELPIHLISPRAPLSTLTFSATVLDEDMLVSLEGAPSEKVKIAAYEMFSKLKGQ